MIHINRSRITSHTVLFRMYARLRRLAGQTILRPLPQGLYRRVRLGNRQLAQGLGRMRTNEAPPSMLPEDRLWVADFYREDVERLKEMTGRQFERWSDFAT